MPPVVISVSPRGGPSSGNTRVVITGTGLTPVTQVFFGDENSPLFVVDSATQITAITPSMPAGAPEGIYPVVVSGPTGTSAGDAPGADFTFAVPVGTLIPVLELVGTPLTVIENLRLLVGERIPATGTEADTRFADDELGDAINRHGGNLYLAAGEMWSAKAGMFADLTDVSESGSERKLSQLFRQANQMASSYTKAGEQFVLGMISRPVGKSAKILNPQLGSTFDALSIPGDLYSAINPYASATARFWPRITLLA